MIRLSNISKSFQEGSNSVKVLENLTLEIPDKQFLVLVGANGSGKSTLLNILAGTFIPDMGEVILDDRNITSLPENQRARNIARIFQDPKSGTASELSLLENFRLAFLRSHPKGLHIGTGKEFRKMVAEKVLHLKLGLENKLDQLMGTFSGGQRQALTLLMAAMEKPALLLLDEPAAALDPKTSLNIMEAANRVIRESELTAILVTHELKDAIRYGDRVIQLSEGKIIRDISGPEKEKLSAVELLSWFE